MARNSLLPRTALCVAMLSVGLLVGCGSQETTATGAPSATGQTSTEGTVSFTGGAVALGVGFQWGSGTLTYRGQQYPFSMRGLSVVDVGASRATGTGSVRNLRNLADFNGNYVAVTAGATAAGGGSVGTLRNQNGVTIDNIATSQGLRLTLAPSGVNITLTQ
ncbi:conserved protein of unknown function [Rhodovastum atsumiense]|uniref:DUF1134 domain-containing protein n=1 Tax=Rhodovastum atsumiense TaxID=504468 RepID=A0A5M6IXI9_9PROT|nr:hypothetical protein [Rhodovastum atsumiense]KAA5613056.1 hypothetical protein F1189_06775 [Rhodovastum atsumiense]CAH2600083.1 conserved protein of unknown function [Rhodovastum atsumiense]